MSLEINIEHLVVHVHTQNVATSFIKRLQLIPRSFLMRTKLPIYVWGHVILHVATLICIRPTSYHKFSPLQLVFDHEPNIFHLRIYSCVVYVPIYPSYCTKMGPQRRLGIYIGFESPSIIKYIEPLISDSLQHDLSIVILIRLHFQRGEIKQLDKDIT